MCICAGEVGAWGDACGAFGAWGSNTCGVCDVCASAAGPEKRDAESTSFPGRFITGGAVPGASLTGASGCGRITRFSLKGGGDFSPSGGTKIGRGGTVFSS